jgi:hypothetical protein
MVRALIALYLAPLIASLIFGLYAVMAAPVMLLITIFIATPLFVFLRKKQWLRWWHAVLAGSICGAVGAGLLAATSPPPWVDANIVQSTIVCIGLGAAVALLFWWSGLYRNPAFPSVPHAMPRSMLVLLPSVLCGYLLIQAFPEPTHHVGRIVAVSGEHPLRVATVRLGNGRSLLVPFEGDDRPTAILQDQCWHLTRYWSASRWSQTYSFASPLWKSDC